MRRSVTSLACTAALAVGIASTSLAQGTPQTVVLVTVDTKALATGYRTSKIVGATVVNEANETVGTVDDLIITRDDRVPFVVLAVGGFLGIGDRFVVVPSGALEVRGNQILLRGATRDSLKALPEFKYSD